MGPCPGMCSGCGPACGRVPPPPRGWWGARDFVLDRALREQTLAARHYLDPAEGPCCSTPAHCRGRQPPKQVAHCLSMLHATSRSHLVIQSPLGPVLHLPHRPW